MNMLNIGFGNFVSSDRIISVTDPDSAPIKRIISTAKDEGRLIDATQGRKTMSVIFTDSGHVILCYLTPSRLCGRFAENEISDDE